MNLFLRSMALSFLIGSFAYASEPSAQSVALIQSLRRSVVSPQGERVLVAVPVTSALWNAMTAAPAAGTVSRLQEYLPEATRIVTKDQSCFYVRVTLRDVPIEVLHLSGGQGSGKETPLTNYLLLAEKQHLSGDDELPYRVIEGTFDGYHDVLLDNAADQQPLPPHPYDALMCGDPIDFLKPFDVTLKGPVGENYRLSWPAGTQP